MSKRPSTQRLITNFKIVWQNIWNTPTIFRMVSQASMICPYASLICCKFLFHPENIATWKNTFKSTCQYTSFVNFTRNLNVILWKPWQISLTNDEVTPILPGFDSRNCTADTYRSWNIYHSNQSCVNKNNQ